MQTNKIKHNSIKDCIRMFNIRNSILSKWIRKSTCIVVAGTLIISVTTSSSLRAACLLPNKWEEKIFFGRLIELSDRLNTEVLDVDQSIELMLEIKEEVQSLSRKRISMKKYLKQVRQKFEYGGLKISKEVFDKFSSVLEEREKEFLIRKGKFMQTEIEAYNDSITRHRNSGRDIGEDIPSSVKLGVTMAIAGAFLAFFAAPLLPGLLIYEIGIAAMETGVVMASYGGCEAYDSRKNSKN